MAGGVDKTIHFFDVQRSKPLPPAFLFSVAKKWTPAAARFGVFGGIMFLYFTDWKLFMDKVPFYRGKFAEKEPIV